VLGKASHFANAELAETVRDRDREHGAAADPHGPVVESLKQSKTREPPPLLFDLTSLQRTANKRFGLSAKATLEAAQALYERFKVLTYPRTDSRHLSGDMAKEMARIVGGVEKIAGYSEFARPLLDQPPKLGKRVFDDSKVSDHHAIIPTGKTIDPKSLGRDEQRIFDLVVRRFLGVFYPDAEFAQTEVVIRVGPDIPATVKLPGVDESGNILALPPPPDRFLARGKVRLVAGWQEVAGFGDDADEKAGKKGKKKDEDEDESATSTLPALAEGERLAGTFEAVAKKTKPPSRHTEATLLAAMENAGKLVEDEELRAAMKDSGLGTPATRASIIETLLKRAFVVREGKHVVPTPMGMGLIAALPTQSLASPELTGNWEARLARIARGEEQRAVFMGDIGRYVKETVDAIRVSAPMVDVPIMVQKPVHKPTGGKGARGPRRKTAKVEDKETRQLGQGIADLVCPACKQGQVIVGKRGWGCSRWREGCKFVVWFEEDGRKRSEADLRAMVKSG
jgi:DNA topoisomerase-3